MADVPAEVTSALAQRDDASGPSVPGSLLSPRVGVGDLRVIQAVPQSSADHRIGLIIRVDSVDEFAEVLLVHTAPELATARDVILPAALTSASYDVVVQADLRAAVWTLQLDKRIGHLTPEVIESVRTIGRDPGTVDLSAATCAPSADLCRGTPLPACSTDAGCSRDLRATR